MEKSAWDEALAVAWGEAMAPDHRLFWLLQQSILTSPQRAFALRLLPKEGLERALDVGTGLGALAFDLLHHGVALIDAVDQDQEALDVLDQAAARLGVADRVRTTQGDGYALPYLDQTFDLTVCRLLLQHLTQPLACLQEMARVTRPGGHVLVMDIDDGLNITYPAPPKEARVLYEELGRLQVGDRQIGRKLSTLMRQAGLIDVRIQVLPLLQDHLPRPAWATAAHLTRLASDRELVLNGGRMSAQAFDEATAAVAVAQGEPRFELTAEFMGTGRRPS